MPNLNAALACAQLEQLNLYLEKKRILAKEYEFFKNNGIKFRKETNNTKANYWLMCIELDNMNDRNSFLKYTNHNKITTRPIWELMISLDMYKECQKDDQKNAKFLQERVVNIPSSVIL